MQLEILGTESLGVRGLCCLVEVADRRVLFDPGIALGYRRHGLLPHPVQVAAGARIRNEICRALRGTTDVVISHFHGDHMPLVKANPYQLAADTVRNALQYVRLWTKGLDEETVRIRTRVELLAGLLHRELPNAEGQETGPLTFSPPVPHGEPGSKQGNVMMTRVCDGPEIFVHASDVQLLNEEAIRQVLDWKPTTVLISGPPLYRNIAAEAQEKAWHLSLELARDVATVIIDHHLMRCEEGVAWLEQLSDAAGHRVLSAADFMGQPRCLLEASRADLYGQMPVPEGWHEAYASGLADARAFPDSSAGRGFGSQ